MLHLQNGTAFQNVTIQKWNKSIVTKGFDSFFDCCTFFAERNHYYKILQTLLFKKEERIPMKRHNWSSAERYFLSDSETNISLKDVSKRFRIPYQSVRRHAAKHKWHSKRYRERIEKQYGVSFKEHLQILYEEVMNRD